MIPNKLYVSLKLMLFYINFVCFYANSSTCSEENSEDGIYLYKTLSVKSKLLIGKLTLV